jgi:hypothetical protein
MTENVEKSKKSYYKKVSDRLEKYADITFIPGIVISGLVTIANPAFGLAVLGYTTITNTVSRIGEVYFHLKSKNENPEEFPKVVEAKEILGVESFVSNESKGLEGAL